MIKFRFQDLSIWNDSMDLCVKLFEIAATLEEQHWYRFADQVRSAGLSVPNNIAEGSGADSNPEFSRFLGFARRSVFENANMLFMLGRIGKIDQARRDVLLRKCDSLSRRIAALQKRLRT